MAGSLASVRAAIDRFTRRAAAGGRGAPSSGGGGVPAGFLRVTIFDDSTEGAKGVDRLFDAFEATIDDLPEVLRDALPSIRDAHRAVFTSEGAAGRGSWPALAPSTLAERARLGYGPGPILVRTGALRDHVLSTPAKITRTAGGAELRIAPTKVVAGVPKYHALAMGHGAIPARPMVAIGPAGARSVTSSIQRALRARAAANGL